MSVLRSPLTDMSIVGCQFITAERGWVKVQRLTASGPSAVLRTTDAGRSWEQVLFFPAGSGGFARSHLWPDGRGVVVWNYGRTPSAAGGGRLGRVLYETADLGASWVAHARPVEPPVSGFWLSPEEGWEAEIGPRGKGALRHTSDGGRNWEVMAEAGTLAGVHGTFWFEDRRIGWICTTGTRSLTVHASGRVEQRLTDTVYLRRTQDGGWSWEPVALPLPPELTDLSLYISPPVRVGGAELLLPLRAVSLGDRKVSGLHLLPSHDGGQTWVAPIPLPGAGNPTELVLDARHWLVGDGPHLHETRDGGESWAARQVLAEGLKLSFAQYDLISGSVIWGNVGARGLVRSLDAGASWEPVAPPMSTDLAPAPLPEPA